LEHILLPHSLGKLLSLLAEGKRSSLFRSTVIDEEFFLAPGAEMTFERLLACVFPVMPGAKVIKLFAAVSYKFL
jgi:hypothetical protein